MKTQSHREKQNGALKSKRTREQKMKALKKESATGEAKAHNEPSSKSFVRDLADEAGLPKVDFYKTDKWIIVGKHAEVSHVAPKNTIPEPLAKAFVRSSTPDPVTDRPTYNRKKFTIDEYPDFDDPTAYNSRVTVSSHDLGEDVADVEFHKDTFVVFLYNQPKSGVYPFSKDDLLKAVDVAKWQLEMFVLPKTHLELKG